MLNAVIKSVVMLSVANLDHCTGSMYAYCRHSGCRLYVLSIALNLAECQFVTIKRNDLSVVLSNVVLLNVMEPSRSKI
jgi:hypothetical protein